ncbi:MAG: pentapeptide repeat-containing protein [Candidatus Micrarchaeota archaeon]|nr:pentapeptide repeat-containing protein [Candidatus Micrarchaeota archaeon]
MQRKKHDVRGFSGVMQALKEVRGPTLEDRRIIGVDGEKTLFMNFTHQVLCGTEFLDINLGSSTFIQSVLICAKFEGVNSGVADFTRADLREAKVVNSNMPISLFRRADLRQAQFINTNLNEAVFDFAELEWSKFRNTNLTGATFHGAYLARADFFRANLSYAKLYDAVDLEHATNLGHARFYNTEVTEEQAEFLKSVIRRPSKNSFHITSHAQEEAEKKEFLKSLGL